MRKKQLWYLLAATILAGALAIWAGCSQNSGSNASAMEQADLLSVTPEYTSEWPDNAYTERIPRPAYGTMEYVCDYSDAGRYMVALTDITKEQSGIYVDELKEQGFIELASKGNRVSTGVTLSGQGATRLTATKIGAGSVLGLGGR